MSHENNDNFFTNFLFLKFDICTFSLYFFFSFLPTILLQFGLIIINSIMNFLDLITSLSNRILVFEPVSYTHLTLPTKGKG